jgi:hypothetical protein
LAAVVYILCFLTSLTCAYLLLRAYRRSGVRLLLWSGLCFVGFATNNALLFADRILVPHVDLQLVRSLPTLIGLLLLLYGLVWEAE